MRHGIAQNHWLDAQERPAGGCSYGVGFAISWQNGPLGRDQDRKAPNGAFVEDIIAAARDRIAWYESTGFACKENREALHHLGEAMMWLDSRTKRREAASIEGTHAEEPAQ